MDSKRPKKLRMNLKRHKNNGKNYTKKWNHRRKFITDWPGPKSRLTFNTVRILDEWNIFDCIFTVNSKADPSIGDNQSEKCKEERYQKCRDEMERAKAQYKQQINEINEYNRWMMQK